jgi:diaminohydroxyphosphoribosylaminopyrimidine deaminase / 5-amino-6-(5-phosphoribosylamino)uracil reductase
MAMDVFTEGTQTIAGLKKPEPLDEDQRHMLRALELAEGGRGRTSPNPLVGAVIVRDGRIIGEGFHEVLGGPHAEVNALESSAEDVAGSTMYVTLEPCTHHGRTPPCADRVAESGITRVVMAIKDPNPDVSGAGESLLRERGLQVEFGPYTEIARRQNEGYLKWVTTAMPFVTLKMAMSLDGKVATRTGESKWISSEVSRSDAHLMRAACDAIMVGIGTVVHDNPRLTARTGGRVRNPVRVVVDSLARTSLDSNVADTREVATIVAVSDAAPDESVRALEAKGVEVIRIDDRGKVDLRGLLEFLGERGVSNVLVEGGPELTRALWEDGLVDKLVFYFAPKVIGGCGAPGPIGGSGVDSIERACPLTIDSVFAIGTDFKVIAYPGGV